MRQQAPLTPGRRRLRTLSSLRKRGALQAAVKRSARGRVVPQLYTITQGWKGILIDHFNDMREHA